MINSFFLIFAFALFVKCNAHLSNVALPLGTDEEAGADQGSMSREFGEDLVNVAIPGAFSSGRSSMADEDRRNRIFMLLGVGQRGGLGGDGHPAISQLLPARLLQRQDRTPGTAKDDHYNANDLVPVARRNLDTRRCMIGRVYRPCWQS